MFACRGVMTVHTRRGTWVVPPMRAVWIPAEMRHSVAMSGPVSMRTLYFLPGLCRVEKGECAVLNVSPLFRELILHACNFKKLRKNVATERRIIEIIVDQLKVVKSVPLQLPQPSDPRALRVAAALAASTTERAPLSKLCRESGASKRTIQRLFLEETKMTFGKWQQQSRLLRAVQALACGEKVTTAALEAGYNSPSAFISMFRKQLGTTPGRYLGSVDRFREPGKN